jgi:hypothetical protein
MNLNRRSIMIVCLLGLAGCGSATSGSRDGGGGSGGSGGGVGGGATDMTGGGGGDLGLVCSKPGPCSGGGVCCTRSIGPHQTIFCDTANSCPLQFGVDTTQSSLCATVADCYGAQMMDLGTLYCCPDPNFSAANISTCRNSPCPVP